MLRVAHWMFRRRPHSGQPRYVPGRLSVPTGRENVRRTGSLMVLPAPAAPVAPADWPREYAPLSGRVKAGRYNDRMDSLR
jgi:hypothetical protein